MKRGLGDSVPRLLTRMLFSYPDFFAHHPESLAVGCPGTNLLAGTLDSEFDHQWTEDLR